MAGWRHAIHPFQACAPSLPAGALTPRQKRLSGALHDARDAALQCEADATQAWLVRYHAAPGAPDARPGGMHCCASGWERWAQAPHRAGVVLLRPRLQRPPGCQCVHCLRRHPPPRGRNDPWRRHAVRARHADSGQRRPRAMPPCAGLELGRPLHLGRSVWVEHRCATGPTPSAQGLGMPEGVCRRMPQFRHGGVGQGTHPSYHGSAFRHGRPACPGLWPRAFCTAEAQGCSAGLPGGPTSAPSLSVLLLTGEPP